MSDGAFSRREALKAGAALGLAALAAGCENNPFENAVAPSAPPLTDAEMGVMPGRKLVNPVIGIQTGPTPLVQGSLDDLNRNLDMLQKKGGINALFPFIFTKTDSTAAMTKAQGYANFVGGNFAMPHMQYYKNTKLTFNDMRAPDFGDIDLLERVIPVAKKKGIKTFAWILEDHSKSPGPAWDSMYEIDIHGRRALKHPAGACYNNPDFIGFELGLVEDYCRSYDIDGVMWANERQGGLFNAIGAWAGGATADPSAATCFCEFCQARGKAAGIDVEKTKRGFLELENWVKAGRGGQRPEDGFFVTFFRLLLKYPELLAWENLWTTSRFELQTQIYNLVKSIKPQLPVGTHVWHTVTFSPFHRAEMDYAEIAKFTDFIKPVLYNNCAGERMKTYVDSVTQTVFGDFDKQECTDLSYEILNYKKEAPYAKLAAAGFTPDYVMRETARTVAGAPGKDVWPGIDIDVPVPAGTSQCTAESVKEAVIGAFKGGATGLILSRNVPEMNVEHLAGAGMALDELHLR